MTGHRDLTAEAIKSLENDYGHAVKTLAKKLSVNRTFLACYLEALENQGYVKQKKDLLRFILKVM